MLSILSAFRRKDPVPGPFGADTGVLCATWADPDCPVDISSPSRWDSNVATPDGDHISTGFPLSGPLIDRPVMTMAPHYETRSSRG
jgi:hypothetical protein